MRSLALVAALALAAGSACSRESPRTLAPAPAPAPAPAQEPSKGAKAMESVPPPIFADAHAKVGPAKCKTCHRAQHDSWSASPHAKKGLDCEGCHGGGADYVKVMRDRKASAAAGLVMPKRALCRACHQDHWHDDMYFSAHAHAHGQNEK